VNANTYHVLRVSAAYFAGTSTEGFKTQRYITFAGLAVKDPLLPSSPSVQNIIEEIPVFTGLELKDSRNVIYLLKGIYWNRHRIYWAMPLEFK
jgi:hypothetical protein